MEEAESILVLQIRVCAGTRREEKRREEEIKRKRD